MKCSNQNCESHDSTSDSWQNGDTELIAVVQVTKDTAYDYEFSHETFMVGKNLDVSYGEGGSESDAEPYRTLPYVKRIICRICEEELDFGLDMNEVNSKNTWIKKEN